MRIRLISDIHLELSKSPDKLLKKFIPVLPNAAEVLIIAGDLGNPFKIMYKIFLQQISKYYKLVLLVAGNHEYYQKSKRIRTANEDSPLVVRETMLDVEQQIRNVISDLDNVHFLNRDTFEYSGIRFLGCTLWTQSDSDAPLLMNDYSQINNFTPDLCNLLHEKDKNWLEESLSSSNLPTVVITHHLPSYDIIDEKYHVPSAMRYNKYFASDLHYLLEKVDVWCCGHSHTMVQREIHGCRCFLNPHGYTREHSGFIEELIITIAEKDPTVVST